MTDRDPLLTDLARAEARLAAFTNPELYERENQRLSTHGVPRLIDCAEELPEHLVLPRGCPPAAQALLEDYGIALVLDDQRDPSTALGLRFQGQLTAIQEEATQALLAHDTGVPVAPPGSGKTVIGIYLVAPRGTSALILVYRKPLLDQ